MPSLISFKKCLARPGAMLREHLINVKKAMEYFFEDSEQLMKTLIGLAGMCHDLGKSHAEWQEYINKKRKEGPNHSACGAFFFSYLGYNLLQVMDNWDDYCVFWLWLTRDIADHHSKLKHLSDDAWLKRYSWEMYDLSGIEAFIHEQYDELRFVKIDEKSLESWIDNADEAIEDALDSLDLAFGRWVPLELMNKLQLWRKVTTSLIGGDRFDVTALNTNWIDETQHVQYSSNIDQFCSKNRNNPLSKLRMSAQRDIMRQLEDDPNQPFYTLVMPTGYGKTITALKIATWLGETQGYKKIIYVAPYLSILEQTSLVIQDAMKERALEHHSLAVLDIEDKQRAEENQLAMEAWAHSIVCTSFNQFWKALFPKRAQDVLRRAFLNDSVIIIDEPQIFNPEVWNLFLCALESLTLLLNLKVLFLSATMPPFIYGLSKVPTTLQYKAPPGNARYELKIIEGKDEESLAKFIREKKYSSQAVILNTIEDAYRVYKKIIDNGINQNNIYLLHGLMTPLHKKVIIEKIKLVLNGSEHSGYPLYVISTQVLEAGVDLSFQHVARALSILPSIVQAAGRVNRHNEGTEMGIISVFSFKRSGEKDTRSYIYPKNLQKITDQILLEKNSWTEAELTVLVQRYYKEMFRQNTYEGILTSIKDAYLGDWEQISQFHPLGKDYLRLPIFVPWEPDESEKGLFFKKLKKFYILKEKFKVTNGNNLYDLYRKSNYMAKLSFEDRKQFMILFHHYVINVPVKKALQIVGREDYLNNRIPSLYDSDSYDSRTGLMVPFYEFDIFI
jgi:CRISPR-associated endonuclease/helicase Cas3